MRSANILAAVCVAVAACFFLDLSASAQIGGGGVGRLPAHTHKRADHVGPVTTDQDITVTKTASLATPTVYIENDSGNIYASGTIYGSWVWATSTLVVLGNSYFGGDIFASGSYNGDSYASATYLVLSDETVIDANHDLFVDNGTFDNDVSITNGLTAATGEFSNWASSAVYYSGPAQMKYTDSTVDYMEFTYPVVASNATGTLIGFFNDDQIMGYDAPMLILTNKTGIPAGSLWYSPVTNEASLYLGGSGSGAESRIYLIDQYNDIYFSVDETGVLIDAGVSAATGTFGDFDVTDDLTVGDDALITGDIWATGTYYIGGAGTYYLDGNGIFNFASGSIVNNLDMTGGLIANVLDPVDLQDAATKNYVDTAIGAIPVPTLDSVTTSGNTTTNDIYVGSLYANYLFATTSIYASGSIQVTGNATAAYFFGDGSGLINVSGTDATRVLKAGDTMTGDLVVDADILVSGNIYATGSLLLDAGYAVATGTITNTAAAGRTLTVSNSDVTNASDTMKVFSRGTGNSLEIEKLSGDTGEVLFVQNDDTDNVSPTLAIHNYGIGDLLFERQRVNGATSSFQTAYNNANDLLYMVDYTGSVFSSGSIQVVGNATAGYFFGDGSGLTGVSGTDATKVLLAGDTMTGQLTVEDNIVSDGNITASTGTATFGRAIVGGTADPDATYPMTNLSAAAGKGLMLYNTAAGTSGSTVKYWLYNGEAGVAGDTIGSIAANGQDDTAPHTDDIQYGGMNFVIADPTAASKDGEISFSVLEANSLTEYMDITGVDTEVNIYKNLDVTGKITGATTLTTGPSTTNTNTTGSVCVGYQNTCGAGVGSAAIGYLNTTGAANYEYALGDNNTMASANSYAFGRFLDPNHAESVMIGVGLSAADKCDSPGTGDPAIYFCADDAVPSVAILKGGDIYASGSLYATGARFVENDTTPAFIVSQYGTGSGQQILTYNTASTNSGLAIYYAGGGNALRSWISDGYGGGTAGEFTNEDTDSGSPVVEVVQYGTGTLLYLNDVDATVTDAIRVVQNSATTALVESDGTIYASGTATFGAVNAAEYWSGASQGITGTVDVRDAAGTGSCTLTFTDGLLTSENCP